MVLHFCSTATEMTASTLPLILCITQKTATTCCSKVPQGLSFPLDVTGIFTGQWFQKVLVRDSDYHVKSFMHVAIQTTGHCATLSKFVTFILKRELLTIIYNYGEYTFLDISLCFHNVRTISSKRHQRFLL